MYGTAAGAGTGQAIFTDDVSLQVFMEHLKRLVRPSLPPRSFRFRAKSGWDIDADLILLVLAGCWCADELKTLCVSGCLWLCVFMAFSLRAHFRSWWAFYGAIGGCARKRYVTDHQ